MDERQVIFVVEQQAELVEAPAPSEPLGAREVAGRTLYSAISSGTELAVYQGQLAGGRFPTGSGYAAVFEVTAVGAEVGELQIGDRAFCMGNHRSWQRVDEGEAIRVPDGQPVEQALFARFMGVTMSTLVTTAARPPDRVVITGLGLIGVLAAQVFGTAGYRVLAVDPDARRRGSALELGVAQVAAEPPLEDPAWAGEVSLVLECAGHEGAALAGVNLVRKRGEVVLVGVPWARRTDLSAHELTNAIFHRYAVLRSGWEWEVPRHSQDYAVGSIYGNLAAAMDWLASGRVRAEGLYQVMSPRECQEAYQGLLHHTLEKPAVVFDWSLS